MNLKWCSDVLDRMVFEANVRFRTWALSLHHNALRLTLEWFVTIRTSKPSPLQTFLSTHGTSLRSGGSRSSAGTARFKSQDRPSEISPKSGCRRAAQSLMHLQSRPWRRLPFLKGTHNACGMCRGRTRDRCSYPVSVTMSKRAITLVIVWSSSSSSLAYLSLLPKAL